ncbi:MAG: MarC family protein [Alphaproteobacteria bacterium]|nr:MarC family protein [Alphaproteobacteria bacterium]
MLANFNFQEFVGAFFILFAIMNVPGTVPVVLNLQKKRNFIKPAKAGLATFIIFVAFFYGGNAFLNLFGVDISSFAVAGSIIIFIIALSMILDIEIGNSNNEAVDKDATIVPVVFPLIAGSGSLTTLLSIRAHYATENILLAVLANSLVVYIILKSVRKIEKIAGIVVLSTIQKVFGIILLTIAVKLFTTNLATMVHNLHL